MSGLQSLKKSLSKLKKVNTLSETFEVDDIKFGITVLTRQEEIDSQSWATVDADGLGNILRLEIARLSYGIKTIDDIDLPPIVTDPDTGDKMERHIFLRGQLLDLPSSMIDAMTHKYNLAKDALRKKLGLQKVSLEDLFAQAQSLQDVAEELAGDETPPEE